MQSTEIRAKFSEINVWKREEERAVHKPLLILFAIGKCVNNNQKRIPFVDLDGPVAEMLKDFGPPRKSFHSCLLYTSPSPRDATLSRMPSSA